LEIRKIPPCRISFVRISEKRPLLNLTLEIKKSVYVICLTLFILLGKLYIRKLGNYTPCHPESLVLIDLSEFPSFLKRC
jgi:hypothetical protein